PSLAREHFEKFILPLLENRDNGIVLKDKMRTFIEYSASAISKAISSTKGKSVLLTGGGAHNTFLVERIVALCGSQIKIQVGSNQIIDFKEAIIFAFLGVLRCEGMNNALRSVTGASRDSSGGLSIGL
ncbi:MAG: anhydro-N-acetylmuramic acid kinase, partial [Cyclobacteriaceae bacterium]